ncbi:MAG: hypothetical protein MK135_06460, partial [Polyangiaceae bacterium]|nr:hypothetical protein [Polyangiaceae bacterium]
YTARQGFPVEIQAQWVRACRELEKLAQRLNHTELAERAKKAGDECSEQIQTRFWCQETQYPYDCLESGVDNTDSIGDASIRPNALIALATAPEIFPGRLAEEIVNRVEEHLLTERGIRSLDPRSPRYIGHCGDTLEERRAASHQGTVWAHLLLYYVRARLALRPDDAEWLTDLVVELVRSSRALGYIAQSADGDSPHQLRGSPTYALATALILEVLVDDLGIASREDLLFSGDASEQPSHLSSPAS